MCFRVISSQNGGAAGTWNYLKNTSLASFASEFALVLLVTSYSTTGSIIERYSYSGRQ